MSQLEAKAYTCDLCQNQSTGIATFFMLNRQTNNSYFASIVERHFWPNIASAGNVKPLSGSVPTVCDQCYSTVMEFNKFYTFIERIHRTFIAKIDIETIRVSDSGETITELYSREVVTKRTIGINTNDEEYNVLPTPMTADCVKEEQIDDMYDDDENIEYVNVQMLDEAVSRQARNKNLMVRKSEPTKPTGTTFKGCRCRWCNVLFPNMSVLLAHKKTCTKPEPRGFRCRHCGIRVANFKLLLAHKQSCVKPELTYPNGLQCRQCWDIFANPKELYVHKQSCKATGPVKRKTESGPVRIKNEPVDDDIHRYCPICQKVFPPRSAYTFHVKNAHPDVDTTVICDVCNITCTDMYQLTVHIKGNHTFPPVPCHVCGKVYSHRFIKSHIKAVHTNVRHVCETCGRIFKRKEAYRDHMSIHQGVHLYPCQFCDRSFRINSEMYRHVKKYHAVEHEHLRSTRHKIWSVKTVKPIAVIHKLRPYKDPAIID